MANLNDYLAWRGDLSMKKAPLCEVDNMVFSLLSYVNWEGIVPPPGGGHITLREAAKEYFFARKKKSRPLGLMIPAGIIALFQKTAMAPRYRALELSGFVNEICTTEEKQFSAITFRLPDDNFFVAFRGTDDTIVGWREDFNLAFLDSVPSQLRAVEYLNELDLPPDSDLYIGGHSKGGNLAVWGAVHACDRVKRQIKRVWSNDGPGFSEGMTSTAAYRAMSNKFTFLIPDDSVVGLFLEYDKNYQVVHSTHRGIRQHDGISWEVLGDRFVRSGGLSSRGQRSDAAIRKRLASMSKKEKESLVRMVFDILDSTGAKTLTDLNRGNIHTVAKLMQSVAGLSHDEQEMGLYLLGKLLWAREDAAASPGKASAKVPAKHAQKPEIQFKFRWEH